MFVDGSAALEVLILAVILGGTAVIGLFHFASWLRRGAAQGLDAWVALWSALSCAAIALRCAQMSTDDVDLARACVKWIFIVMLLLIPVLFRMALLLARGSPWARVQGLVLFACLGLALVAPWTELFVQGEGQIRSGLLGGHYFGFEPGPLVLPMMTGIWLVYPTILYILAKGRSQGRFKTATIAIYTLYVLIGSVEILDALRLIVAPGLFPYALFLQALGMSVLGGMRHAEASEELALALGRLRQRNETLDVALTQVRGASLARTRFLANMSHELRTPLSGVLGMAELLDHTPLDETQQRYVETLRRSGQGLLELIGDVLDFAKIDAGELVLEQRTFAVLPMLEDCLRAVAIRAHSEGLELALIPDPDMPPCVVGDEARLRQVVTNLLGNAVKFTEKGSICLRVNLQERLIIQVQDTGIGIPADRQDALFQPFVQADDSTTRRYGGTGLGLSITAELVRAMGGTIHVHSIVGTGTSFQVCLPLVSEGTRPTPSRLKAALVGVSALQREELYSRMPGITTQSVEGAKVVFGHLSELEHLSSSARRIALIPLGDALSRERAKGMGVEILSTPILQKDLLAIAAGAKVTALRRPRPQLGGRVLVVEDNVVNQTVIRRMLESIGYEVVLAEHGQAALERMEGVQMVVMDCQMPIMDGYQATRQLRELGYELPILGLSANALAGDAERAVAAGMDRYLTKPVDFAKLEQALKELAEGSELGPRKASG